MNTQEGKFYIGTITEIIDPDLYQIKIDIPGVTKEALALPMRGEVDEPQVGNVVLVKSLDPIFQSVYLYSKLKENTYIGFRSRGKMCNITPDYITIGIFDPTAEYLDEEIPEVTSWAKMDKDGNIEIVAEGNVDVKITGNATITIEGNKEVKVSGNETVTVEGNQDIKVSGNCTIDSPKVQITGGQLTVNGTASPNGQGAFCGIPVCPFSGAPHIGNMISGT